MKDLKITFTTILLVLGSFTLSPVVKAVEGAPGIVGLWHEYYASNFGPTFETYSQWHRSNQLAGSVGFPELIGFTDDSIEFFEYFTLIVDQKFRVAHHVHEQDMSYLRMKFRFGFRARQSILTLRQLPSC